MGPIKVKSKTNICDYSMHMTILLLIFNLSLNVLQRLFFQFNNVINYHIWRLFNKNVLLVSLTNFTTRILQRVKTLCEQLCASKSMRATLSEQLCVSNSERATLSEQLCASNSVRVTLCEQLLASNSERATLCEQLYVSNSVWATLSEQLWASNSVRATMCKQLYAVCKYNLVILWPT